MQALQFHQLLLERKKLSLMEVGMRQLFIGGILWKLVLKQSVLQRSSKMIARPLFHQGGTQKWFLADI
jgi:hypothetical protein